MSKKVDCDKQDTMSGTCLPKQEADNSSSHCGQCSTGSRKAPEAGSSKIHSCSAHMAPARSVAESLIPFMFLLAILGFGIFFLGTPRKAPAPETIRLTPTASGMQSVTTQASEQGK